LAVQGDGAEIVDRASYGRLKKHPKELDHMKRLIVLLSLLVGLLSLVCSPAHAAGIIPGISMTQQFGTDNKPLNGGKLYLIQAGTTSTPQNCYQDSGLTLAWPNPITLDSAGRIPQIFCADGSIKIRLTNSAGIQQLVADNILVVGPSGGGGGGGSVDTTAILNTGDFKLVYNTGTLSGFVRCNGRTIGNATSGATERANSDTSALFSFLWAADSNLSVSGGRGADAATDFAANKTIALPDCRNVAMAGLGDMGNSDRALFSGVTFNSGNSTTLGSYIGAGTRTLVTANLPPYTPSGTIAAAFPTTVAGNTPFTFTNGGCCVGLGGTATGGTSQNIAGLNIPSTFTGTAQGGTSTPVATVQPTLLVTVYIKL
jgi:hypothetical protein